MPIPMGFMQNLINEGYRPICLSATTNTDWERLIFSLQWQGEKYVNTEKFVPLMYNFTKADIIFLHEMLPNIYKYDITLKIHNTDITVKQLENILARG